MGEMFAAASKHFDPQLILQQTNLLADARLRGIEALGCCRYVEFMVRDFPDVAQLLKLHANLRINPR